MPSNLLNCAGHRHQEICLSVNTIQGNLLVVAGEAEKDIALGAPKGNKKMMYDVREGINHT